MKTKKKQIVSWILSGLVTFIFFGSGLFKLFGGAATLEMAKAVGGQSNLEILAYVEFIIVALFWIPRTAVVGALLMVAYMGGAMAALFVANQPIMPPTFIEVIVWVAIFVRFPELSFKLLKNKKND